MRVLVRNGRNVGKAAPRPTKAKWSKAWAKKGQAARALAKASRAGVMKMPAVSDVLNQAKGSGRPMKVKLSMKIAVKPGKKVDRG